jgi:hypothetical protein
MSGKSLSSASDLHGEFGKMYRMYGLPEELSGFGDYRRTKKNPFHRSIPVFKMRRLFLKMQVQRD